MIIYGVVITYQAFFQALYLYLCIYSSKPPWDIQLSSFYNQKHCGRMMLSNSLKVIKLLTDWLSQVPKPRPALVGEGSRGMQEGGTWTRRQELAFWFQNQKVFLPRENADPR